MDNNQNIGQPMENQNAFAPQQNFEQQPQMQYQETQPQVGEQQPQQEFEQPQQTYNQSQMNYGQPQQTFAQSQMNYGQPQQMYQQPQMNYGQPQQMYQQPQMNYGQPQQMYQQPQQGFAQPQMQYNNMQPGYGQPQRPAGPKKPVNKKALGIAAAVLAVVILAIIFIPKLFGGVGKKTPFDGLKIGMTMSEVAKELDIKPDYEDDTWYKRDLEAFGAVGRLQIVFEGNGILDRMNWYVDEEDCESSKAYNDAIKEIKKYYTKKYGEPEIDGNEYNWELSMGLEYELEVNDDDFVLRYR